MRSCFFSGNSCPTLQTSIHKLGEDGMSANSKNGDLQTALVTEQQLNTTSAVEIEHCAFYPR